jgi:para-nitrobenzyl esterase
LLSPQVRGLTKPRVLRPIRDGWLLPEDERPVFQSGRLHAMPLIVGSNTDEGTLLTQAWPVDTLAGYRDLVAANFGIAAEEAMALYPARSDGEVRAAVAALFADTQFNYGTRLLAQGMAAVEPRTWKYLFTRRRRGRVDGPDHGDEVPHVFATLDAAWPHDENDLVLSRVMRKAWVRFAETGNPQVPQWEPYRSEADNHLVLGDRVEPGSGWRRPQLDFLERLFTMSSRA